MTRRSSSSLAVTIPTRHRDNWPARLDGEATVDFGDSSKIWPSHDGIVADYFNWNGSRAGNLYKPNPPGAAHIAQVIRQQHTDRPHAPIIIVGNSWGGHTAWEVCRLLNGQSIPNGAHLDLNGTNPAEAVETKKAEARADEKTPLRVERVLFLDPSSLGRNGAFKPTVLPDNIAQAVNYFTHNSFGWQAWPDEPRIENIDLGDPTNGFIRPGGPQYDSAFNFRAHVAAEWDNRIHTDIRKRIAAALIVR